MKEYILFDRPINGGTQQVYQFPNGYGASVVRGPYTYGGKDGKFEIAVLKFGDGVRYKLCYDTEITDDVLGHIEPSDVDGILHKIQELPTQG